MIKLIIYSILLIVIIIILLLIKSNIEINNLYLEFNKLVAVKNDKLSILDSIKINPNLINKKIKLNNYLLKIKKVEIIVTYNTESTILSPAFHYKDNTRNIKVIIEHKNKGYIIELNGDIDSYRNLNTTYFKIDETKTEKSNILYFVGIKEIHVHDDTNNWFDLILDFYKYEEKNTYNKPLYENTKPIRTNLLNPNIDVFYKENTYAYKTPYKNTFDDYGYRSNEYKDNIQKSDNVIRKTIKYDNKIKKNKYTSILKNGESQTIINK